MSKQDKPIERKPLSHYVERVSLVVEKLKPPQRDDVLRACLALNTTAMNQIGHQQKPF